MIHSFTYLAQDARIAHRADAGKVIHFVDALARISTRIVRALVDVRFAVPSCKANRALLLTPSPDYTGYHINSSPRRSLLTGVALGAGTVVVINQVDARGSVLALALAVVQVFRTGSATPSLQASALEATRLVVARLSVDAGSKWGGRVRVALVHV